MPDLSWIALAVAAVSAAFAGLSAWGTARQAKFVRDQTEIQRDQVEMVRQQVRLQREQTESAAQPYVWADIQPDPQVGHLLQLVVCNAGPTVATNVRVTSTPGLPMASPQSDRLQDLEEVLRSGLSSLAPGRALRWSLGMSHEIFEGGAPEPISLRVEADGPHGPLVPLEIRINFDDWAHAQDAPEGSLYQVRKAIQELKKSVDKAR
ncbi:hypothetical protein M3B68_011480 [Micrococcus luteus]|uniref:hypothetical protein n=1 Tax=Micrococcus luteus TaxID=1270 RepID=UPI001627239F|nr:hypothetical protein [Micrococcus luteus]MCV7593751.1 hypothetical protein [Micrococcus luteus]